jgi:hypothetical protein
MLENFGRQFMTKAREFLTAGVVAAMFAAGIAAATPASARDRDYGDGWRGYPGGGFDGYDFDVALLGAAIGAASLTAIPVGATRNRYDYPRARACIVTVWDPMQGYVQAPATCH